VTSPDGRQLFVGTATPAALDDYLTGAPYDVVVDLASGGKATTRPVPGTQQPARPEGQTFWRERSVGSTASISSALDPGTALVVMNADARPGVDSDVVVTYRVPGAWTAAWVAVGAGVLLIVASVLFFWRARVARRRRDERRAQEAAAAATAAAPVSATTVLPADPAADATASVPAWAAAPVALSGDELAGPPTGGLVVESVDGAEAVVSAAEAPNAAPAPPEAGWYPGAGPAGTAALAVAADDSAAATPEPAADDATAPDAGSDPEPAREPDPAAPADPSTADDSVDTWHDETRPVPLVPAPEPEGVAVAAVADPSSSPHDEAVYDELGAWFREEPGSSAATGSTPSG
ncbi:MAG TPA: hypothetical protein VFL59_04630, partial [Candidatus Nanopelagicales bacterium]|nr:hypothetical protein [Candidatus Nanopelagicales bacterium]